MEGVVQDVVPVQVTVRAWHSGQQGSPLGLKHQTICLEFSFMKCAFQPTKSQSPLC